MVHEWQKWNNCGPATLAMGLSFWGWSGTQAGPATALKPDQKDANVMPYEMVNYITGQAGLAALSRLGGDLTTLKRLIAAGFPPIVEKGFWVSAEKGWMGHYTLLTGYDDARNAFISQDSYEGPNHPRLYADVLADWRAFDYQFIVIFPAGPARPAGR